jgi:hypothetical protein
MSITVQPAENIVLTMDGKNGEGEQKISIPEYYRQFYSATVTKPRLPCVQVRHSESEYICWSYTVCSRLSAEIAITVRQKSVHSN